MRDNRVHIKQICQEKDGVVLWMESACDAQGVVIIVNLAIEKMRGNAIEDTPSRIELVKVATKGVSEDEIRRILGEYQLFVLPDKTT